MRRRNLLLTLPALALAATGLTSFDAQAQSVADFYKGRTVTIFVGVSPGGIYSTFAQILARHLGSNIPGNPTVIVKHQPGAGGTKMVNFFYNAAPKDGTALSTPNAGIPKRPYLKIGNPKYDPQKMTWIGGWGEAVNVITLLKPAPVSSFEEAMKKEVILGAIGKTSNTFIIPTMMNNLLGTKFKLISGYRGGSPVRLAIEKREVAGWSGQWLGWKLRKSDWVRDGKLQHLVQLSSKPAPDLPGVPQLTSFAKNPEQMAMFKFVQSGIADRAAALPPGVPADRVAALTAAYKATLMSPTFLAETKKQRMSIDYISPKEITDAINEAANLPTATLTNLRKAMGLIK